MDRARGPMPSPPLASYPACRHRGRRASLQNGADQPERRVPPVLFRRRRTYPARWTLENVSRRNGLPRSAACLARLSLRAAIALEFLLGSLRTSARPAPFHLRLSSGSGTL